MIAKENEAGRPARMAPRTAGLLDGPTVAGIAPTTRPAFIENVAQHFRAYVGNAR